MVAVDEYCDPVICETRDPNVPQPAYTLKFTNLGTGQLGNSWYVLDGVPIVLQRTYASPTDAVYCGYVHIVIPGIAGVSTVVVQMRLYMQPSGIWCSFQELQVEGGNGYFYTWPNSSFTPDVLLSPSGDPQHPPRWDLYSQTFVAPVQPGESPAGTTGGYGMVEDCIIIGPVTKRRDVAFVNGSRFTLVAGP
jgi:hypothetical protein